jgi:hypothetical protein
MRQIQIGGELVKESDLLRQIADNLDQVSRLQEVNRTLWGTLSAAYNPNRGEKPYDTGAQENE